MFLSLWGMPLCHSRVHPHSTLGHTTGTPPRGGATHVQEPVAAGHGGDVGLAHGVPGSGLVSHQTDAIGLQGGKGGGREGVRGSTKEAHLGARDTSGSGTPQGAALLRSLPMPTTLRSSTGARQHQRLLDLQLPGLGVLL